MINKFLKIILFLVLIDQFTKSLFLYLYPVSFHTPLYSFLYIFPVYNDDTVMGYIENPFGLAQNYKFLYTLVFLLLSLGSIWTIKKIEIMASYGIKHTVVWALAFICAAGLGNALDRFTRGAVVDFMYFKSTTLAFNFADIFAYIGIFISLGLCSYIFINYKRYNIVLY